MGIRSFICSWKKDIDRAVTNNTTTQYDAKKFEQRGRNRVRRWLHRPAPTKKKKKKVKQFRYFS